MPLVYVIDTSALIQMKNDLPDDVFKKAWDFLAELATEGRLIAPHEVLREIEKGDDELVVWARAHPAIFVPVDDDQGALVALLGEEVEGLIKDDDTERNADPWVVALAEAKRRAGVSVLVVANENRKTATKIPRLCDRFGLDCVKYVELFRREGKTF
jgi:hypothetical protein